MLLTLLYLLQNNLKDAPPDRVYGTICSSALPIEAAAAEEPIYVNAKQYHAILRRRQLRALLDESLER
jgi:nuclear transcription factor Y alpha